MTGFRSTRAVTAARAVTVPGLKPDLYDTLMALAKRHDVTLTALCRAIIVEAAADPERVDRVVANLRAS